jgi:RHS repeat-associated protein
MQVSHFHHSRILLNCFIYHLLFWPFLHKQDHESSGVVIVPFSREEIRKGGGDMRSRTVGGLAFIAVLIAFVAAPGTSRALPTDKVRRIAMIYQCESSCVPPGTGTAFEAVHEFLSSANYLAQTVDVYSTASFNSYFPGTTHKITDFDLIVWYNDYPAPLSSSQWTTAISGAVVDRIKTAKMPTLVFDGAGFFVTQKLGLIPEGATGDTDGEGVYGIVRDGFGDMWHPLVQRDPNYKIISGELQYDRHPPTVDSVSAYSVDLGNSELTDPDFQYTRPLYSAEDSQNYDEDDQMSAVTALVDDRRHIVAFGGRTTAQPGVAGDDGQHDVNNLWWTYYEFVHEMVSYLMTPDPSNQPIGQNTFTETDWTTKSRGFDFTLKRTYTSGAKKKFLDGSVSAPLTTISDLVNWWFSFDQYIVWDRFNDSIIMYNETGQAIPMELVQGVRPEMPGGDPGCEANPTRVFTTVNNPVAQVAIYYDGYDSDAVETYSNPPLLGSETDDSEKCAYHDQSGRDYEDVDPQEGFLVRDAAGNKAFFAFEGTENTEENCSEVGSLPCGVVKEAWTRGGELRMYRLAYLQDALGNRQDYYYSEDELHPQKADPLVCIVDTEGRGYSPDYDFAPIRGSTALTPGVGYNLASPSCSFCNPRLESVTWGAGGETKEYLYSADTDNNLNMLMTVQETDPANPSQMRTIASFTYEAYNEDNFKKRLFLSLPAPPTTAFAPIFYPGRLATATYGASTDATTTTYQYYVKDGYPVFDDLNLSYAVTTATKNGVSKATVINGRQHVIKTHESYVSSHWPDVGVVPSAVSGDVVPGPCNTLPSGIDPTANCPGWTRTFTTNYDGQIVYESSPFNGIGGASPTSNSKGRVIQRIHNVDTIFGSEVDTDNTIPADDEMLEFWRADDLIGTNGYWYLRYWTANEIETATIPNDGTSTAFNDVKYEPVFNKPVQLYGPDHKVIREFRYDYQEGGPLPAADLFEMMFGSNVTIPHPTDPSNGKWYIFAPITWSSVCNRPSGVVDDYDDARGNVICEILPATTPVTDGGLAIPARSQAATVYAYDAYGREKYSESPTGRVVTTAYSTDEGTWGGPYSFTYKGSKAVTRVGSGTSYRTLFHYNEIGQIIAQESGTALPGDFDVDADKKMGFDYNLAGQQLSQTISDGANNIEQHQEYIYDVLGQQKAIVFDRCPSGSCDDDFNVQANDAGDELMHVFAHDSKGRVLADCSERGEGHFDCTTYYYNADDFAQYEAKTENCALSISADDSGEEIQSTLKYVMANGCPGSVARSHRNDLRDGRNRIYKSIHVQYVGGVPDDATKRITYICNNFDDKPVAVRDAADSDNLNGEEWTHNEYDGYGRLVRMTSGLTSSLAKGSTNLFAKTYYYNWYDKVLLEITGVPDSTGYTNNGAYGYVEHTYDERQALVATKTYQYTVGTTPTLSSAGYVKSLLNLDQENKLLLERTRTAASGPTNKFLRMKVLNYDVFGRLTETLDFNDSNTDRHMTYEYDALDRVWREKRFDWYLWSTPTQITEYGHDASGHTIWSADVNVDDADDAHVTNFDYDGYGYLISTVDPKCQQTLYARDGRGNALETYERFDATIGCGIQPPAEPWYFSDGSSNKNYYDVTELPELGPIIRNVVTYDSYGNATSRTDDLNYLTQWVYNGFGEVTSETLPSNLKKQFTRNADGAVTEIKYYQNTTLKRTAAMALDLFNRILGVKFDGSGSYAQNFWYLSNGLPVQWIDYGIDQPTTPSDYVDKVTSNRSWDTLGNVISDTQTLTMNNGTTTRVATTSATFQGSNLATMTLPTATGWSSLSWSYNDAADLTAAKETYSGTTYNIGTFTLSGAGVINKQVRISTDYTHTLTNDRTSSGAPRWDEFGRLGGQKYLINSSTTKNTTFSYNPNDRLTLEDEATGGTTDDIAYTLDDLDRVAKYEYDRNATDTAYNYDEVDNIRQSYDPVLYPNPTSATQTRELRLTANGLNQVASVYNVGGAQTQTLSYDDFGNLTKIDRTAGTVNDLCFVWDRLGRMITVTKGTSSATCTSGGGTLIARYFYDAMGRRAYKQVYSTATGGYAVEKVDYHLFGNNVVEELHQPQPSGNKWLFVIQHDPTATDRYLRFDRYNWNGTSWYGSSNLRGNWAPMTDIRNNVMNLVYNSSGSPVIGYSRYYDLYGNDSASAPGAYMPYRFAGREYDAESAFYYYRTRYYSPDVGRFISLDTIGIWGDLNNYGNGYAYVGGMANGMLDPEGKGVLRALFGDGVLNEPESDEHSDRATAEAVVGGIAACLPGVSPVVAALFGFAAIGASQSANEAKEKEDETAENRARAKTEAAEKAKDQQMQDRIKALEEKIRLLPIGYNPTTGKPIYSSPAACAEATGGACVDNGDGTGSPMRKKPDDDGGGLSPEDVHDLRNLLRRSHGGIYYGGKEIGPPDLPSNDDSEPGSVDDFFDPLGGRHPGGITVRVGGLMIYKGAPQLATVLDQSVDDFFNPREGGGHRGGGTGSGIGVGGPRNPNDSGAGFNGMKPELGTGGAPGSNSMESWLGRLNSLHRPTGHVDPPPFQSVNFNIIPIPE